LGEAFVFAARDRDAGDFGAGAGSGAAACAFAALRFSRLFAAAPISRACHLGRRRAHG
jgi:hypothetical protein